MAKPAGIKLVIKSINDSIEALKSNVTDKYNLLIIVENINDAFKIAEKCEEIKVINIGGLKKNANNHQIDKAIFLSNEEIEKLLQLYEKGIKFDTRMVPNDTSKNIIEEIRKVNI